MGAGSWQGRRRVAGGIGLGAAVCIAPATAEAVDFEVTDQGSAGFQTLRGRIAQANVNGVPDRITFAANITGDINLTTGEIPITEPLEIVGPGQETLSVSGNGQANRIFDITANEAGAQFSISGLTLKDGGDASSGGAIAATWNSYTGVGLAITDTTIRDSDAGAAGGGIYSDAVALSFTRATISGNTAGLEGGGVYSGNYLGDVEMIDSTFTSNTTATEGGGLFVADNSTLISGSTFSGNHATGGVSNYGGGIYARASALTISNSTFSGNDADDGGGGISTNGNTGADPVAITGTTMTGNTSASGPGGGAWLRDDASVTITNSTVSGNSAATRGGGLYLTEGYGQQAINASTIAGNTANTQGGGIAESGNAVQPALRNSIVAGNNSPLDPDVDGTFGTAFMLIQTPGTAALNNSGPPILNADPLLGPLAANGGLTQTRALGVGSPALDAAQPGTSPSTDQRGVTRPQGPLPDLGAFERTVAPPVPPDTTVTGAKLKASKKQKVKGKKVVIKATAKASERVTVNGSGKVRVGKKSYKLKPVTKSFGRATASAKTKLKFKLKKRKDNKRVVKALKRGKKAKARLKAKFSDEAGNKTTKKTTVRLKK